MFNCSNSFFAHSILYFSCPLKSLSDSTSFDSIIKFNSLEPSFLSTKYIKSGLYVPPFATGIFILFLGIFPNTVTSFICSNILLFSISESNAIVSYKYLSWGTSSILDVPTFPNTIVSFIVPSSVVNDVGCIGKLVFWYVNLLNNLSAFQSFIFI